MPKKHVFEIKFKVITEGVIRVGSASPRIACNAFLKRNPVKKFPDSATKLSSTLKVNVYSMGYAGDKFLELTHEELTK